MSNLVVIGGGLVGLATALQCQKEGLFRKIVLIEKEAKIAQHQSTHNSGVLHCGLYYKPASLKALMAVEGLRQMLDFCRENDIEHDVCGKVVVATDTEEEVRLRALALRGEENGLSGLRWLDKAGLKKREPHAFGVAALEVPQEGIVDYRHVADRMASLFEERGGELKLAVEVLGTKKSGSRQIVETSKGDFEADYVVSCAGLQSDRVAHLLGERSPSRIVPFRGDYYELGGEGVDLVKHLIYPVPDPVFPFLGVHFTRKIEGGIEAGPNAVLAFKREGYHKTAFSLKDTASTLSFPGFYKFIAKYPKATWSEFQNAASKKVFLRNLQRLVPEVELQHLLPGGSSGVRAQAIDPDGQLAMDFRITRGEKQVHVINAPSPAATASLAIGGYVAKQISS